MQGTLYLAKSGQAMANVPGVSGKPPGHGIHAGETYCVALGLVRAAWAPAILIGRDLWVFGRNRLLKIAMRYHWRRSGHSTLISSDLFLQLHATKSQPCKAAFRSFLMLATNLGEASLDAFAALRKRWKPGPAPFAKPRV